MRRDEDWKHQVELAKLELDQLAKQITAAKIRKDIAVQSQAVHERTIDQSQEVFDFLRDRIHQPRRCSPGCPPSCRGCTGHHSTLR